MARVSVLIIVILTLMACNDGEVKEVDNDRSIVTDTIVPEQKNDHNNPTITGCFIRVLQRDTLVAVLEQDGKKVKGKLSFDNFEKDGSSGPVTGVIDNDIVKLVYRFQSEGMNSISEVFFRITADGLIHGFGDIGVKGDSAYYSDVNNIRYNEREKLVRVPCEQLAAKYK